MAINKINYFGYGANADPEMMTAITGKSDLRGIPAILHDHSLRIQRLDQVPEGPRQLLESVWNPDFRTYVAVPEKGYWIKGVVWQVDKDDRRLIRNWELVKEEVGETLAWRKLAILDYVSASEGRSIYGLETETLGDGQAFDESISVDGLDYPLFLMPREEFIKAAITERERYLAELHEGQLSRKEI